MLLAPSPLFLLLLKLLLLSSLFVIGRPIHWFCYCFSFDYLLFLLLFFFKFCNAFVIVIFYFCYWPSHPSHLKAISPVTGQTPCVSVSAFCLNPIYFFTDFGFLTMHCKKLQCCQETVLVNFDLLWVIICITSAGPWFM